MVKETGTKRKLKRDVTGNGVKKAKQARLPTPSPPGPDFDRGAEGFIGDAEQGGSMPGGLIDPMIDIQPSYDSDEEDEEDNEDFAGEEQDDGENGVEAMPDCTTAASAQAGPSRKKSLFAPPTLAELETLQSASTSSSSSSTSFTLQLSALLSSILLPTTPHPALKSLLTTLHSTITSLPHLEPISPKAARKKVDIPLVAPEEFSAYKADVKWTMGWEKPGEVFVGGSWGVVGGYKRGKGEMGGVNMVVVMPQELLSPKDRLDYRYFHKRAYFLSVIKSALEQASRKKGDLQGTEVTWDYAAGDRRRPVIAVTAGKEQGLKHRLTIRIHASAPPNIFPPTSLSPTRALVRHESLTATPSTLYNTSIVHDTLHKINLLHLHRLSQLLPDRTVDSFFGLWRIWCRRRGISRDRGGSGWFASMVLSWVIEGGEIGVEGNRGKAKKYRGLGKGLGHWPALRAAWEFLAQTDFANTPVFLASDEDSISRSDHLQAFDDVFVDSSGSLNTLAGWERGDLQLLQHHARETLALLEDPGVDSFAEVFLRDRKTGLDIFDEWIRIDISQADIEDSLLSRSEFPTFADRVVHKAANILRRGLSDRVVLVHVVPLDESTLSVGLLFNRSQATRVLDVGPASDQVEAGKAFNELWGEKADLRRFKDGSIAESVVWDITRPEDAAMIPGRIVQYLLGRHLKLPDIGIKRYSSVDGWATILQLPDTARDAISTANSQKLGFRPILDAYQEFYKFLKSVDDDLPLSILNVSPASELLRYSSTFIPHPIDIDRFPSAPECLKYAPRAEVVLQFESSPKWPEDLAAVQKVKMAILAKLADLINERLNGARAGIVLDEVYTEVEDHVALEVYLPQGSIFLLRIHYEREQLLLERALDPSPPTFGTSLPTPPRRLVLPAMEKHTSRFIHLPKHHSSLLPLHHRYPSYSTATRLLKRWFASHMLSPHIRPEVAEMLMASIYLSPGSLAAPSSATTGFLRALEFLARWDWRTEPVIVPSFSDGGHQTRARFDAEKRKEGIKAFEEMRKRDPEMEMSKAWVVMTEDDVEGLRWTKAVGRVVASRVRRLAGACRGLVEGWGQDVEDWDIKSLFTTPLEHYDNLLYLDPSVISRSAEAISPDPQLWEGRVFRNLVGGSAEEVQGVKAGYDPVGAFVRDLQRIYADTFLVFYDAHGGNVIGLVWNPTKEQPRSLKAFLGYSTKPSDGEGALVRIDRGAILGEICRLGRGMIREVK